MAEIAYDMLLSEDEFYLQWFTKGLSCYTLKMVFHVARKPFLHRIPSEYL